MEIIQVGDEFKNHWNSFVQTNGADGGLLQSWEWGDFQKALENKIFRIGAINGDGKLQAAALIVNYELPFENNYFYCPRGPVIDSLKVNDLNSLFVEIKKIAKEEKSFLFKVDPPWALGNEKMIIGAGLRKGDYEIQPKCSLVINIDKTEEELLSLMKPKTRYNIGLAQRKGVKIKISDDILDVESFWQLVKQTAGRDGFQPHSKEHYKKMFDIFSQQKIIRFFSAEYDNKIIAMNMVSFFGGVCTYLHGASANMYRDTMAPYLLQWHAILEAKKIGFKFYDFGGVNGNSFFNERWKGITRFKTGFSPETKPKEYIGEFELVLNPIVFSVYKFIKQIRG